MNPDTLASTASRLLSRFLLNIYCRCSLLTMFGVILGSWTPLGDFCPPDPLFRLTPHFSKGSAASGFRPV